ncbi:MAG: hypothetical protein WDW38_000178 [Sanguina aurantia]
MQHLKSVACLSFCPCAQVGRGRPSHARSAADVLESASVVLMTQLPLLLRKYLTEAAVVIQLQGDQRKNVQTFLIQEKLVKKDMIKIHGF